MLGDSSSLYYIAIIKKIEERYVERFDEVHRWLSREIAEPEVGES